MSIPPLDKYLAIDCEMVSVIRAVELAKIGIVDHTGAVMYESYSFVDSRRVVDWNTATSGIKPGDLDGAPSFESVRAKVKEIVKDKIIVGHAVFNDLAAVQHRHPYEDVRDTALYYPLRRLSSINVIHEGQYPSLKALCKEVLGEGSEGFQQGKNGHCPVEDARAAMKVFLTVRKEYEEALLKGQEVVAGIPTHYEKWYW